MTTNNCEKKVRYNSFGKYEEWLMNGKWHREDGPAWIGYYESGKIKYEEWYINGKSHREDGPARIKYYKSGNIQYESWHINRKRHREGGPVWIDYYKSGKIKYEEWRMNEEYHRKDGPARIWYYESGNISCEKWYVFGKNLTKDKFNSFIDIVKKLIGRKIFYNRCKKLRTTESFVKWYYAPNGIGGKIAKRCLEKFATGLGI